MEEDGYVKSKKEEKEERLRKARENIYKVTKIVNDRRNSKKAKLIKHSDYLKMMLNITDNSLVNSNSDGNGDGNGESNENKVREKTNEKIEKLRKELKDVKNELEILINMKLSMIEGIERNSVDTEAYNTAVDDINLFKNSKSKRKKIKDNYAIACCIIEQLTWKLHLNLVEYLNIEINNKGGKKGKSKNGGKGKDKSMKDISRVEDDNIYEIFDGLIKRRDEIEKEITTESFKMINEERQKKDTEKFVKDMEEYRKKNCYQRGRFIGTNWSKLSKEDKMDRIESYFNSKMNSFNETETDLKDQYNILNEKVVKLLEENKLKAEYIKWKKNLGYIKEIELPNE